MSLWFLQLLFSSQFEINYVIYQPTTNCLNRCRPSNKFNKPWTAKHCYNLLIMSLCNKVFLLTAVCQMTLVGFMSFNSSLYSSSFSFQSSEFGSKIWDIRLRYRLKLALLAKFHFSSLRNGAFSDPFFFLVQEKKQKMGQSF